MHNCLSSAQHLWKAADVKNTGILTGYSFSCIYNLSGI